MSDQPIVDGIGPLREYSTLSDFPTGQSLYDKDYFGRPPSSTIYKAVDTGKFYQFVSQINDPSATVGSFSDFDDDFIGNYDDFGKSYDEYQQILNQPVQEIGQYVEIPDPSIYADNAAWGYKILAGSPDVLMDVSCGFMNSLSSYTILDLGNAGQANWNALDGTTGQTKSVGSTISTTNIIDRPVTSVISGVTYMVKSLGSTSQDTWNNMAGTAGVIYYPGDLFSATTTGTGTGTVDIYQGNGKVRGTGVHVMKQRFLEPMVIETDYATVVSVVKDLENIRVLNGNPAESNFNVFVYWMGESDEIRLINCISSLFVRFK